MDDDNFDPKIDPFYLSVPENEDIEDFKIEEDVNEVADTPEFNDMYRDPPCRNCRFYREVPDILNRLGEVEAKVDVLEAKEKRR